MLDGGLPWFVYLFRLNSAELIKIDIGRTQNGIPEFIENLGYVGGFSPSAYRDEQQQTVAQQRAASVQQLGVDDSLVNPTTGFPHNGGEENRDVTRHGLNTVLEQWLGDVLGAGDGGGRGVTAGGETV